MTTGTQLLMAAETAASNLHSDRSLSLVETLEALKSLLVHVEMLIDAIREDIHREELGM
jgi:hypothetical protein